MLWTGRPHEPATPSVMEDEVSQPVIQQFPFMKLPSELRSMIYKEFSTLQGIIQCRDRGILWTKRTWQLHYHCEIHESGHDSPFDSTVCALWSVSKTIRNESVSAFFRYNDFHFDNLNFVHDFLSSIGTDSRRALTSISLNYNGSAPARALKVLNECIGLRKLAIGLNYRTLRSIPYSQAAGFDLMRLYGMKDLLKVRDIVKMEVITTDSLRHHFPELGMPSFEAALQVLKQPRTPAQLKRQEKKDYPPQKATRATFGKTNFTTRMDKKTQSTPAS